MTTLHLIRHADHGLLGKFLAGRAPGLHLSTGGRAQAEGVAAVWTEDDLVALYSSPLERALQTAWPLAQRQRLPVRISAAWDEIDFGQWTMKEFSELDPQPAWQEWNERRATGHALGGESMQAVRSRVASSLERFPSDHPGAAIAVVSHCDVIKTAVAEVLRLSLDHYARFEIDPASITTLRHAHGTWSVTRLNAAAWTPQPEP